MTRVVLGGLLLLAGLLSSSASAQEEEQGPRRLAVVVGARAGALGRGSLQYAHRDAEQVASALRTVAHFEPGDIQLLLEPDPREVLAALDRALATAAMEPRGALLLFYYSGHADDQSLYPSGKRLEFSQLRSRLDGGATVRIGIIDACRGGGWTGAKGLSAAEPFEVRLPMSLESEGSILLASSSGDENAHEAEAIGGSIFTHHFVAGLRGAADGNADGDVSVTEVFGYARDLTIRDSTLLTSSPQHPSFSFNVRGRVDLPLARPLASPVTVSIRQTEGPLVILDRTSGRKLVELPSGKRSLEVALPPGRYLAVRRRDGMTHSREFRLSSAERFVLHEGTLVHSPQLASASKGVVSGPRHTLTVSPVSVIFGVFELEFERALTTHWTLYVAPSVQAPIETYPTWRPELKVGARYFFFGQAPSGLFGAAQAGVDTAWMRGASSGRLGVSLQLGYSAVVMERVVLSFSAGPAYDLPLWESPGAVLPLRGGLLPRLRGMIGAAF